MDQWRGADLRCPASALLSICVLHINSMDHTEQKCGERGGTEAVFHLWRDDYWHFFKKLLSMEILQDKYKSFIT